MLGISSFMASSLALNVFSRKIDLVQIFVHCTAPRWRLLAKWTGEQDLDTNNKRLLKKSLLLLRTKIRKNRAFVPG